MTDISRQKLVERLQARSDNEYCDYINRSRRDECLGWEAKVRSGQFGEAEMEAHKNAAIALGVHRGLAEAIKAINSGELDAEGCPNQELLALLEELRPFISATAEAHHMLDGFKPRIKTYADKLVDRIDAAINKPPTTGG